MTTTKKIFALDIGTRKVMGLWAQYEGGVMQVLDSESVEHPTRAMSVGQIQNISRVTDVVRQVTQVLGERCGERFHDVAVAVAGRNLKTILGKAVLQCSQDGPLESKDIERLTFNAVDDALRQLSAETESSYGETPYYCVGYIVSRYLLDGDVVLQPGGHRGSLLEAEVLATFLPRPVLESQLAVLEAAGLEAVSVTLEPIAALQAIVDPDLKNFDLALVDVGAGTSDIALVQGGCVRAFGMVPYAGDSITERISNEFLLDFHSAERIKRAAINGGILEATNIFKRPLYLESSRILAAMSPAVSELASRIAKCIREIGSFTPRAILCVGGGSLTPGLLQELADALSLPPHCVGMCAPGGVEGMRDLQNRPLGPETATPLGIAYVATSEGGVRFRQVYVNGNRLFLLELEADKPLTVLSALMAAGISAKRIFGWPGPSKTYTVNGEFRIFKARATQPAQILIQGVPVGMNHPISHGDRIEFIAADSSEEAFGTIAEALELTSRTLAVDGRPRTMPTRIFCGGRFVDPAEPLRDRMNLMVMDVTLRDVLIPQEQSEQMYINGRPADLDTVVRDGDRIETALFHQQRLLSAPVVKSLSENPAPQFNPHIEERGRSLGAGLKPITVRLNGKWLTLKDHEGRDLIVGQDTPPILVDALRHISIGPSLAQAGKRLKLLINGHDASFTSPLHDGADVKVFFE